MADLLPVRFEDHRPHCESRRIYVGLFDEPVGHRVVCTNLTPAEAVELARRALRSIEAAAEPRNRA